MKKNLLYSCAALALSLVTSVTAWADDVVYGLVPSYTYGAQTASFDLSSVNTSAATSVAKEFSFANAKDVKCGTTAGNKYYAFVDMEDPDTYDQTVALVTLNFTTGEMVVVNDFSYGYGKPGYNASGMTYDDKNGILYATQISFNDDNEYITTLYSVNPDDGSMTWVTEWTGQYQAIAADHNGGFYLLQNEVSDTKVYPSIYKVSSMFGISDGIKNTTVSSGGWSSYNSMVTSADGNKVYLVESKKVLEFDTQSNTIALKGQLSDNVAAIAYGKSSENGIHNDPPAESKSATRFLVKTTTYGSTMGDIANDVESKHELYYYNSDGKIVGSANYGREYGEYGGVTDKYTVTDIMKSSFDEMGNITNKDVYQWGMYDFDDFAWKKTRNCESMTYNADGTMATDTIGYDYYVYTYNEDGTVASVSQYVKRSNTFIKTIEYSNYDTQGHPWHYSSKGAYEYNTYEADLAYDEDGNKVQEYTYTVVQDPDNPEWTINNPKEIETWQYEDGILTLYTKNTFDEEQNEVPSIKTEYTPVDGNTNEIKAVEYGYYNGEWYQNGLPKKYSYVDFADMKEMTQIEAMAEADPELKNTVDIYFTVPQLAMTQDCRMVVYRDCVPVDSVNIFADGVYDETSNTCIYKDKNVKNGKHTYFLQPVFAAYSDFGVMGDTGDDFGGVEETPQEWAGYYSTNPFDVEVYTELPAVTDLALADGRIEKAGNILSRSKTYYATISWKNPENAADYGFLKNSIYFTDAGVAELDTTNIAATNAEVMLYDEDARVYVVTSYIYGKAISDTIDVKLADIDRLTDGITPVSISGATAVTFNGNNVQLAADADVAVFSMSGERVMAEKQTSNVALGSLPKGTYIIFVEKDGKKNAYKYTVK